MMYKLEHKMKTTVFINFNKTGAMNVNTNVFIFAYTHFYAPVSKDLGHIVIVPSVCLFVCLLSTLTFAITFEPLEVETSYLACILH